MPTSETFKKKQLFSKCTSISGDEYPVKPLRIEVFGYNHHKVANDLHEVLKESGFLDKHPLFSVKIETMDGYTLE